MDIYILQILKQDHQYVKIYPGTQIKKGDKKNLVPSTNSSTIKYKRGL